MPFAAPFSQTRPNFVFLLADDQDLELGSINYMPNLAKHVISKGLSFDSSYVATPICCSSRTETLTGRYYQNIGAPNGNCMHVNARENIFNNTNSWFQMFEQNNYKTAMFGKLTNDMTGFFCKDDPPMLKGFSRITAPCHYNDFYGTWYLHKFDNGSYYYTNDTLSPELYQTTILNNASLDWLDEISVDDDPFVIWYGTHAPHYPAVPPEWYANTFNNISAPRTPNFNVLTPDHHGVYGTLPLLEDVALEYLDQLWRDRLESMLIVDDYINDLVNLLDRYNILNNTYIIYTSDHGYHIGQWRIGCEKKQMYETDIKVPLYIRGPGISENSFTSNLVGNVDILPTMLELSNITFDRNTYDGKSFVNSLTIKQNKNNKLINYEFRKNKKNKPILDDLPILHDCIFSNINNNDENDWRTYFMIQFVGGNTATIHDCPVWFPTPSSFPGSIVHGPESNPNGSLYYILDPLNNFRAIRIINDTTNWSYGEFVYKSFNESAFENPWYYELYDMDTDPYQYHNIYQNQTNTTKQELHQLVMSLGACNGDLCP